MSKSSMRVVISGVAAAVLGLVLFLWLGRTRPVTAQDLQGEWVQDPDFIQHAGADLDAQKREVDEWENYQFAFSGAKLTGWRLIFDDSKRDGLGWAQGRGVSFESDFALSPVKGGSMLKFSDHAKTAREAGLAWEGEKLTVALGERKFRLVRKEADQLRARNLVAGQ